MWYFRQITVRHYVRHARNTHKHIHKDKVRRYVVHILSYSILFDFMRSFEPESLGKTIINACDPINYTCHFSFSELQYLVFASDIESARNAFSAQPYEYEPSPSATFAFFEHVLHTNSHSTPPSPHTFI